MKLSDTVPCWTCELCRRMDGVQDPDTCPYGDGWCDKYRAWASEAWGVAVGPFKVLEHMAPPKPPSRMGRELEIMQRYNKNSTEKLRDIVRNLKEQLDLRKIYQPAEED